MTDSAMTGDAELLIRAQAFVDRKYVARSDARQQAMGLSYVEAERQDLARELAKFVRSESTRLPPPADKEALALADRCEDLATFHGIKWPEQLLHEAATALRRLATSREQGAMLALSPKDFVDAVLSACDASNWDADLNKGDYFRGLHDAYEAIQLIAMDYQTAMYEATKRLATPSRERETGADERGGYEDRHPNDLVLHPLTDIREWDEALAVLGIQDSDQTPADAIRELQAEIERLSAPSEAKQEPTTEQLTEWVQYLDWDAGLNTQQEVSQLRALLNRIGFATQEGSAQTASDHIWRCFHCDEVFTDPKAAANHFGVDHVGDETLCQMAQVDGGIAKVIADLSEELQRYRIEDNASYREFYALGADHRAALIREEQKGYDRGLSDAKASPSPQIVGREEIEK